MQKHIRWLEFVTDWKKIFRGKFFESETLSIQRPRLSSVLRNTSDT
jgi:hypothetical protein